MSDLYGGEGWWLAPDGKWYPPEQHPNYQPPPSPPPPAPQSSQDEKQRWLKISLWFAVGLTVLLVIGSLRNVADKQTTATTSNASVAPEVESPQVDRTVVALEQVWATMSVSDRVEFCTEVRAAGSAVAIDSILSSGSWDEETVTYWLDQRCGD